ncbi:bifunctional ornithine acetyltransferase/N-acetylglutamate synthase [Streptomyces sp. NPDC055103]
MSELNPIGFRTFVANLGVKDDSRDFSVVASEHPCTAAAVFTQSRFAGPSVLLSREHVAEGAARAVVTVSENANVANGERGRRDAEEVVAEDLTRQVARDGEGATKLIEVVVDEARDEAQARRVAKAIVNSPLVKTAVHGSDPSWGRIAMAVGKCKDGTGIDPDQVVIHFGDLEVYPEAAPDLERLTGIMAADEVLIHVSLVTGTARARVWGCDLSDGYVRINADYTT